MEQESIKKLNQLHPKIREDALKAYTEAVKLTPKGVHPVIIETLRTFERSAELYAQGRTKPGKIVSQAKAGQSYHNYGLALDFALDIDGKIPWKVDANWMIVVNIFKKYDFEWGGDWIGKKYDAPHLEKRFEINWRDLLVKHNDKDFIEGTNYVKI